MIKNRTLLILMFLAIGIGFVGACRGELTVTSEVTREGLEEEPPVTPKGVRRVEDLIEGIYSVANLSRVLGYLELRDGQYWFTPQGNAEETRIERFIFTIHTKGSYDIEYYGSVNQNTSLDDLKDSAILLRINFSADEARQPSTTRNKAFLLRIHKEEKILRFGSIYNEFELWSISKSLD